jgi:hypothetical protein
MLPPVYSFLVVLGFELSSNLTLATQALYHLSHSASLFSFDYFELGSRLMSRLAWTLILLFVLPVYLG